MRQLLLAATVFLLAACQDPPAPKVAARSSAAKSKGIPEPKVVAGIEGYYTGDFETPDSDYLSSARITIRIDSVRDGHIWGMSLVAGNERPFTGTVARAGNQWTFTGREPGTDPHDGVFSASITGKELEGTWASNDRTAKYPDRSYKLERRVFRYDPNVMIDASAAESVNSKTWDETKDAGEMLSDAVFQLNASTQELHASDVENLYKTDLEVLRNSIYARHGYSFRNARMRAAFDHNVDWYMPVSTDVTAQLTPLELKNIALLKRYEGHATKYYDSFGR
ncbi:YARHG domain-containing protein [Flaviaesturariibacter terrae]